MKSTTNTECDALQWAEMARAARSEGAKTLIEMTRSYLSTRPTAKQLLEYDQILAEIMMHLADDKGGEDNKVCN